MDSGQDHRDLTTFEPTTVLAPLWQRLLLLSALLALGLLYIAAFVHFKRNSHDFIAARRNAEAAERALVFPSELPQQLEFMTDQPAIRLLGVGWHQPEPEGVWSWRREAVVQLSLPRPARNLHLRIEALGFISPAQPRQELQVWVDEMRLGTGATSMDNGLYQIEFQLPAALQQQDSLALRLIADHVGSPFRDGSGDDARTLGIKLQRVTVSEDAAP